MEHKFEDIEINEGLPPPLIVASSADDGPPNEHTPKHHKKKKTSKSKKHRHDVKTITAEEKKETDSVITEIPPEDAVPVNDSFWARQSKRVARSPCFYLLTCMFVSIGLSAMAMVVGEFSVSANTGGWQSRGTLIADRQTQLMIAELHGEELFYGDNAAWDRLINNVQSGWEDDDDDSERRLSSGTLSSVFTVPLAETSVDYMRPHADRIDGGFLYESQQEKTVRDLPFHLTPELHRRLQSNLDGKNCDLSFYNPTNLTMETRLWPIWKTKSSSQSVLDPPVLRDICRAEAKTQEHLEKEGLCFGCEVGCLPPFSIVMYARLMVDDGWSLTCAELAEAWAPLQAQTEEAWVECVQDIKETYDPTTDDQSLPDACPLYFFTTMVEEGFDKRNGKSRYTSSIFATEYSDALYEEVDHYDRAESSKVVEGAYDTQNEDFVYTYTDESLSSDMALAMGSALVVACAILLHTRSPFITAIGLLQIILSFPLSFMVYKLIAGLEFFPFLNFIGVFVVFALGAGDIFVAFDKWKNARLDQPLASTEVIAAQALPDAAVAMFLTTLTTAVAFFSTAICPVAPIKMFAIFCGLLVMLDYIMNVLLVFPALCIYDRSIQARGARGVSFLITCSCCGLCKDNGASSKAEQANKDLSNNAEQDEEEDLEATARTGTSSSNRKSYSARASSSAHDDNDEEVNSSLIRRILSAFYTLMHAIRWPLFVAGLAALGVCIYFASSLELPTSSDVRLLNDNSQFEMNYMWRQHLLSEALEKAGGSQAYMIWGVEPADTGDHNDPGTWSQLVLDKSFDSSSEEAQVFLRDYCESMLDQEFAIPIDNNYTCPLSRFEMWLDDQSKSTTPDDVYVSNCNGATGIPLSTADWDSCLVGWSQQAQELSILARNNKVTILYFPFNSRVRYDDNYDTLNDEWNLIEKWVDQQNLKAPAGVKKGYFSSFDFWWYDTNGQMLSTAYSSAGIALGCAAAVILFASQSLILTLFCTLTIGYILCSVTATLVAMGWTLGFLESICFAILIGVSVDFVIHLGHAYSSSAKGEADRGFRSRHALIEMGPSILATALTTILSAVVMLFTVITFFQKFALILFMTVVQASIGSFLIFLVMVDCIGPTNPTYLMDKAKEWLKTRRS